ncbi:hypothetical protein N7466_008863 [Penicillium verhagenii]|uniref:uncharacterized protein n=1 Tax=Penicillium verhagenii TaxID=1562060 RepID=UPI0025457587|nr:uncharacterized protein N7466_008863 [Penicillium verhagenii]KAJ5924676.1 hypothetical protein N7466_008863 [Penicillium verhagenii]
MAPQRALFVIDIQNELIADPKTRIPNPERVIRASEEILKATRATLDLKNNYPAPCLIVFVQHEESPGGTLLRGSEPWGLFFPPRADREDEILVAKRTRDTFESNPDLAQRLRDRNITEVITFGLQSDACVEATTLGALAAGFDVTVLSGAHSTYNSDGKTAIEIEREIEHRLSTRGAHIVSWEKEITAWADQS